MSKYIGTRLHKARELAPEEEFFQRCEKLPHYVVDQSLVDLLTRGDVRASINAMVEADIAHLPFESLVIETQTDNCRNFILLEEHGTGFRSTMGVLRGEEAVEVDPAIVRIALGDTAFSIETEDSRTHETWMKIAGVSLGIALLMLNIQGVEKEVIEPTKLNRQRKASGKPGIPTHTVMRIGHVYDYNGNRVGLGAGRTMPVHMRAGHTRRQHYGEGNTLEKIVFIPPVLVNFKPGERPEVRQPKRILAA